MLCLYNYIIVLKRLVAKSGHQSGHHLHQPLTIYNIEERGNATGNGVRVGEGGDNVNGSSEAPTEGIILIVFVLLMMCL